MQQFLKKILLFTLPLLILLCFAETRLRSIQNVYQTKKEAFEKKLDGIELLILGNSHGENAIIPSILTSNGYNLSIGSQSLFYNEKILAKYLPRMKKLKTVIITVDYHSLYFIDQELSAFNNDKFFAVSKKNYDHRFTTENLSYFFFVYGAFPSLGYFIHKPLPTKFDNGYQAMPSADSTIINERSGSVRATSHNLLAAKDNRLKITLIESLEEMIRRLQKENIQAVLVTTPVFHTYYDHLDKNIIKENEKIMVNISAKYQVPYLNFLNTATFSMSDFSDNDHLSNTGAIKFTTMLHDTIQHSQ